MDLSKLDKSEAVAARVYLRNRRKAWDHFYFMQDLKSGMVLTDKEGKLFEIKESSEDHPSPMDITITCKDIKSGSLVNFGFSIRAYEAGFMTAFLRWYNQNRHPSVQYRDSMAAEFKISTSGKVLYGK